MSVQLYERLYIFLKTAYMLTIIYLIIKVLRKDKEKQKESESEMENNKRNRNVEMTETTKRHFSTEL